MRGKIFEIQDWGFAQHADPEQRALSPGLSETKK